MDEFENKKWFHCIYVSLKIREEVNILIVPCVNMKKKQHDFVERVQCVCGQEWYGTRPTE